MAFVADGIEIQHREWMWQAQGLTELHSDLVLVGGRICGPDGVVMDGARHLGYGRGCDSPDRGRPMTDVGYHAQMFKERSVDAVPLQLCVFKAEFLRELLAEPVLRNNASFSNLPAWAGAAARRRNLRVAYSPFLTAKTSEDWSLRVSEQDLCDFVHHNSDVLGEARCYPAHLDASGIRPYQEARIEQRENHLAILRSLCGIDSIPAKKKATRKSAAVLSSRS